MRILHVTDNYDPAVGGLERHVQNLAGAQARGGHEVVVATMSRVDAAASSPDRDYPAVQIRRLPSLGAGLTKSGQRDHQFHPPFPDPGFVRELRKIVTEVKPDVIHGHSWSTHSVVAAGLPSDVAVVHTLHEYGTVCARQTYTKDVTSCHEGPGLLRCIGCARHDYGPIKGGLAATGLRLSRPTMRRVDRFIAISKVIARNCEPGLAGQPVDLIPTFVGDGLAVKARSAATPDWLPPQPYILFVGALGLHKGVGVLADAWRRLTDPPLLVLLGTPRGDAPDLSDPGIIVRRSVPHDQVMAAWRGATVGVVPSVWPEPFGQVAVEALAAGTPVIVSDTGGLPEIVEGGYGELVPAGDVEALRAALQDLLDSPERRASLSEHGPARAHLFEIGQVLPRVMETYALALQRRRGGVR